MDGWKFRKGLTFSKFSEFQQLPKSAENIDKQAAENVKNSNITSPEEENFDNTAQKEENFDITGIQEENFHITDQKEENFRHYWPIGR